ncbi:U3 small nucleolar RNA-associated protein 18 [Galdieria sulphuraria]|nr:U3 small nucleolar RNA-associated protein 18 [Galdieria sulphuraria]
MEQQGLKITEQDNINALFFEDRRPTQDDEQLLEEIVFGKEPSEAYFPEAGWKWEERDAAPSVWHDDEEQENIVHLARDKRLRKLRSNIGEDVVSTRQYEQKLRRLFVEKNRFALDWCPSVENRENHSSFDNNNQEEENIWNAKYNHLRASDGTLTVDNDSRNSQRRKPDRISLQRVSDANQEDPCCSTIFATEFHPGGRLLLVGGLDKILRLFSVDGMVNPKVESIYYANLPIRCAHFILDASRILSAGRRRFLYEFDMVSGQSHQLLPFQDHYERTFEKFQVSWNGDRLAFLGDNGKILLLDANTKEELSCLYASPGLHDVAFSPNDVDILSCGDNGMIHHFDLRTHRCVSKWIDEGASSLHCIRFSPLGNYFAVGNGDGLVHLYSALNSSFSLIKEFSNLTTSIQDVCFHPDNQLLAFASNIGKNKVRLANISTQTVYRNWPPQWQHLNHIQCMSMTEPYFALGNDHGRVVLYSLP